MVDLNRILPTVPAAAAIRLAAGDERVLRLEGRVGVVRLGRRGELPRIAVAAEVIGDRVARRVPREVGMRNAAARGDDRQRAAGHGDTPAQRSSRHVGASLRVNARVRQWEPSRSGG